MNIFQLIANNLGGGPITLHFPKRVPVPEHLRGRVQLNPERCIGCAACAYVCASSAIIVRDDLIACEWEYDAAQCTFCGRCADLCPTRSLTLEAERPPVYRQRGALRVAHRITYPRCPECGQPASLVSDLVLARAFGEISAAVREWSGLCERCRQRRDRFALVETALAARSSQDGH
jgi:formate hydrogenlyase subunit 6